MREQLDVWRQGHNFEGAPPVAVRDDSDEDAFWTPTSNIARFDDSAIIGEHPLTTRIVMVISQGCDIVKPAFPCVTVVPVYNAAGVLPENQLGNIRAGKVWHLVHLTAPWTEDGTWVTDLRLEFSVDKSVLLGRAPSDSFKDEVGYAKLAERLAIVRNRPAVPQPCLQHVVRPLQIQLTEHSKRGANPLAGVSELRIQSNDHANPSVVSLFVVTEDRVGEQLDRDTWFEIVQSVREHADSYGLTLNGPEFGSLWEMSAADYLTSQAVSAADSS